MDRLAPNVHRLEPHLKGARPQDGALARRPADEGPSGRDDLVTRPVCLTGETFFGISDKTEAKQEPFFVDWLTISQEHTGGGLPVVDAGCVIGCDDTGAIEWKTTKAVKHAGSFETSINVKCDGFRVTVSGNVSRFGRRENLFGFGFCTCIDRVNTILAHYGLPPMTAGVKREQIAKGAIRYVWTGARVSRIDVTANYETGSADNAHAFMQYIGSQHAGRHEGRVLGAGETVAWGVGSRRQYWKAYIKHLELKRRGCADPRVTEHCEQRGVVRFEGTLRSNALTDMGCAFLGDYESGWAMKQLTLCFEQHTEVLSRAEKTTDDLDELPKHLRSTARDYLAGMDMSRQLSRASYYRHRRELLPYGIDIAVRNVTPFRPRVRVIELKPASVPSWYQLAA